MSLNVCYLDFWNGFDPQNNWFSCLINHLYGKSNFLSSPEQADVIFASSFGNKRSNYKNYNCTKIFYTGENERPDLDFADFSLSFDYDDYGGKNFRLPHWYLYVNWWRDNNLENHAKVTLEMLKNQFVPESILNRERFCAILMGNPVRERMEAALEINKISPVHGFGMVYNNPYKGCKISLLKNYRYNICFENSVSEGYVTEKLFEAKIAGCIPIYYGHYQSSDKDFNPDCCVKFDGCLSNLREKIFQLEKDKDKFLEIAKQPLFLSEQIPSLENLYNFILEAIQ